MSMPRSMVGPFLSVPIGIPSVLPSSTVGDLLPADAHTNASSQATQHDPRHALSVRPGRPACGALLAPCGCAHNGLPAGAGSVSGWVGVARPSLTYPVRVRNVG